MYGLFAKGEKGHGMAINMIISAMENQISIVLNFSEAVFFLFVLAEPIVIITIAVSIRIKWNNPKKVSSQSEIRFLKSER